MIVVVGQLFLREAESGPIADGLAALIALAAAARGTVQLVGKVGEDDSGDAVILALSRGGVGHVAMLRDPGRSTPRLERAADEKIGSPGAQPASGFIEGTPRGFSAPLHGPNLDAADVDLALRYLTDFAVLVLADRADPEMIRVVAAAADWADARLIVLVPAGETEPAGLPSESIVFESPDADPDGVFAAMVGAFAAALDDGDDPAVAFRASVDSGGWTPAPAE